ncbi:MAG: putative porin [Bacteroidetes bacterium]|nr:putative porin [Bacteroidota bacterium]
MLWMLASHLNAQNRSDVLITPGNAPVNVSVLNDDAVPGFTDQGVNDAQQISDGLSQGKSPHPLGMLKNPVIRTDTRYTYEDIIWRKIDTTLIGFHEYNPVSKRNYPHLYLGTIAQAYRSLVFDPQLQTGYRPGFTAYDKYWYTAENTRYYNTKIPFTSIGYVSGKSVENDAHIVHSQNFGPLYNASFDYRLLNSQGAFNNQKTLIHNLNVNNWFNSKKHRYTLAFAFLFNKMRNFENGGTNFDGLYDRENKGTDRALVPVHLDDAKNEAVNKSVYLKQFFFFGPEQTVKTNDTTEMDIVQRKSVLSYAFKYDNWKYKYSDTESDSSYYSGFHYDSTMTGDSSSFWTAGHTLRWENTPEQIKDGITTMAALRYYASLKYDYTKYKNLGLKETWNNLEIAGGVNSNVLVDKKWHYGISASVQVGPEALGDYSINAFARWKINDKMNLRAYLESNRSMPGQRLQEYRGNHFKWSNDLKPVWHNKASLIFRCDHGDIDGELTWHNVQQFVYLDQDIEYKQAASNLNVLVFRAGKAFDTKHIYFYNGITAQFISERELLRLPKFILKQRLHYQGGFFSGKVTAHLGFDINYYTNYRADGYNPAIMDFHLQDQEELKFYPVMDVFFEIFIKRARIFFMLQNANQGMFRPNGYYVAPNYGAQDRAFKAGVSWQFYD